ncbi:hypothetical protein B7494_g5428 [Chlorociboria aeruginascens]|nr:hypothetical protein B7494_g5428 [Chlorociboria aeruginascens]
MGVEVDEEVDVKDGGDEDVDEDVDGCLDGMWKKGSDSRIPANHTPRPQPIACSSSGPPPISTRAQQIPRRVLPVAVATGLCRQEGLSNAIVPATTTTVISPPPPPPPSSVACRMSLSVSRVLCPVPRAPSPVYRLRRLPSPPSPRLPAACRLASPRCLPPLHGSLPPGAALGKDTPQIIHLEISTTPPLLPYIHALGAAGVPQDHSRRPPSEQEQQIPRASLIAWARWKQTCSCRSDPMRAGGTSSKHLAHRQGRHEQIASTMAAPGKDCNVELRCNEMPRNVSMPLRSMPAA